MWLSEFLNCRDQQFDCCRYLNNLCDPAACKFRLKQNHFAYCYLLHLIKLIGIDFAVEFGIDEFVTLLGHELIIGFVVFLDHEHALQPDRLLLLTDAVP